MKSDYFVEFVYHEEALKQQNNFKFLIEKYKRNKESIEGLKTEKVKEADNFIATLDLLEAELKEFKKLIPTPASQGIKVEEEKPEVKKTKKKTQKKAKKPKKMVKKAKKDLDELKLGLNKIRDELSKM